MTLAGGTQAVPLWRLLQNVAAIVQGVGAGQTTTMALEKLEPGLRAAVQALCFTVLRRLGVAQALRQQLASRAPPAPADALLCTALALASVDGETPYTPFTLVNQAVEAAKRTVAIRSQANFINACLRRFLRESESLQARAHDKLPARWNHPEWWIKRLQADHPQSWEAILAANNVQAPMTLRVNTRQFSREAFLKTLDLAGMKSSASGKMGVVLHQACAVADIPGFAQGAASVQDASAQMAAPLLLDGLVGLDAFGIPQPLKVLDACAAPGGKTAHLLEISSAQVTAIDVDARRGARISQTLNRLGLAATVIQGDAAMPQTWWDGSLFDAILLDAPCTASGIVRRHPDVRWLRRETDVAQLAQTQARLLKALWPLVKPGGRLLYCTCSVFRAEGADQIQTFLAYNTDAQLMPSPGHLLPSFGANGKPVQDNLQDDHDGFYLALLEKRKA